MKTLELFSGTKSFSKVADSLGHTTKTVDYDSSLEPDVVLDLSEEMTKEFIEELANNYDVVWMSPPCQTFSMAAGNKHWSADRKPKTEKAVNALKMLTNCKLIADAVDKKGGIYFIENHRARARWFMPESTRHTVWYCQYGDKRAKPTDIWTNLKNWDGRTCFNGNPNCHHERAPRGSKTGTQGLKGAKERGVIPPDLFIEIFSVIEDNIK